jgi:hypothetical protein
MVNKHVLNWRVPQLAIRRGAGPCRAGQTVQSRTDHAEQDRPCRAGQKKQSRTEKAEQTSHHDYAHASAARCCYCPE